MSMTTPYPISTTLTVSSGHYSSKKPFAQLPSYFQWTSNQILFLAVLSYLRIGFCFVAVITNTALLTRQFKQKMFLKTHCIFGITLTIAQIFFAVSVLLETVWYQMGLTPVPLVLPSLTSASELLSNFSMIAVAVDRYLALYAIPFKYKQVVTIRKYGIIAVGITILSIVGGFLLIYVFSDAPSAQLSIVVAMTMSMALMCITATIYVIVGYYLTISHKRLELDAETKSRRLRQTRKIILTFIAMFISDVVLLLPLRLYTLYLWLEFRHEPIVYTYKIVLISNVCYGLFCLNYVVNPVIYWRQMISDIFPAIPCRRTTEESKKPTVWAMKESQLSIRASSTRQGRIQDS